MSLIDKFPKYKSQQILQNQRIVGLQRGQDVKPLLKTIGGRPNTTKPIVNTPVAKLAMLRDSDPPQSSSDDDQPNRADITRSSFPSKTKPASSGSAATRRTPQSSNDKTRSSVRTKPDSKSEPTSSAARELSVEEEDEKIPENRKRKSSSQEQLRTSRDSNIFIPNKRQNRQSTYSKRSIIRVPKPMKRFEKKDDDSPKKLGLIIPKGTPTKQDATRSPKKGLYVPDGDNLSPTKGTPVRKQLKMSPGRKKLKREDSPEEVRPKFIIPELPSFMKEEEFDEFEITGASSMDYVSRSLSPLSPLSDLDSPISSAPVCAMCSEEVDEMVLEEFKKMHPGPRMTLRQEQLFCVFHKKKSAERIWRKKRFPEIDWKGLDKRIAKHYKFLRAILEGGESHYSNIFSQKIKSGQNRTLLKSEDDLNLSPGYYGTRGLRAMTDNLTWKFSSLLRERAVKDRLISARGHTAYVQAVLVPELAAQLIKDDMGVDVEKARVIMEESITVGELLSEEVGDIVLESDESD